MPRSRPASFLWRAVFVAAITAVRAATAQQVATAPPLTYSSGEVRYRLRLHSSQVMSSPDTTGTSTQRDSADVLLTLYFPPFIDEEGFEIDRARVNVWVDTAFATTSGWPAPSMPSATVGLNVTQRGFEDLAAPIVDGLLGEVISAVVRCLPALPAMRASTWRRSLTVRWGVDGATRWSEERAGQWRAGGPVDIASLGRRVRALRVTGRDGVRVTSDGPSGSGTAVIDAALDTTGVLLSSECTEQDTLRWQWGNRRIVAAIERRAVLTLAPSRTSPLGFDSDAGRRRPAGAGFPVR